MPLIETVTILNKSGKVVSTGKHLVNIFKDAKAAYEDKKAELKADHHARNKHRDSQRLVQVREETRSVASSRHSHRSQRHRHIEDGGHARPPLTTRNLSYATEGSVTSSRRSRSHHGTRRATSPDHYVPPQVETELSHPGLTRRYTDGPMDSTLTRATLPPNYSDLSRIPSRPLQHSHSNPSFYDHENIDMNLAYGALPHDLLRPEEADREVELAATMTKLDTILLEAHCLQYSATQIIANLQANPEAMAAVALTLAELSTLLTKMSPGILGALKASSPAIFALLASPQFLIAGGLALGVTVVMFGGYKIIKKLQSDNQEKKDANRMEEAMVWDAQEMGSVESWRRGIEDVEERSVATSVDGEFITPAAAQQKKDRIRERRREERDENGSVRSGRSHRTERTDRSERTVKRVRSESTIRQKALPAPSSESGRSIISRSSARTKDGKEKKKSPLSIIFSKNKGKGKEKEKVGDIRSSSLSFRPRVVEV